MIELPNQIEKLKKFIQENLNESYSNNSVDKEFNVRQMIRNSTLEKIITKFIFTPKSEKPNDFGLNKILTFFKEEPNETNEDIKKKMKTFMEELLKHTKSDNMLIYSKISDSILNFNKHHQQNPDYGIESCIKIEKLIQEHIDMNFFNIKHTKKYDNDIFNENYVISVTEKHDFNYSINSLFTLLGIMKTLEVHNLICYDSDAQQISSNINSEYAMITEKRLQNYERTVKKNNLSYNKLANIVELFIQEGHVKKLLNQLYSTDANINNYEIESKLCLSVFIIKKLIQDYSFYFSKQELENIFLQVKKFKDFPIPVGSLGMDLFDILINELYFQGITITNKIREIFMLDALDERSTFSSLQVKDFNPVFLVFNEDESKGDISKIFSFCVDKLNINNNSLDKKEVVETLVPREFLIKIFLTVVRNSTFPVTNSALDYICKKFMTSQKNKQNEIKNEDENKNDSFTEDNKKKIDNTLSSLKKILRILDVGLDKSHEEFMEDIHYIAEPLVGFNDSFVKGIGFSTLPITEFRSYLFPYFEYNQKLMVDIEFNLMSNSFFNVYLTYLKAFADLYSKYFSYLEDVEYVEKDKNIKEKEGDKRERIEKNIENYRKRNNLFKNFRLKILLVEDKKSLSYFINQLAVIDKSFEVIELKDWEFWSKFCKKEEFEIKVLVYLLPNIENLKEIFPKNTDESRPYLSEYIANNDYVYQTLVYNPWLCKKEFSNDQTLIDKLNEFSQVKHEFKCADEGDIHSMFLDPAYLYVQEADKVLDVYLYKIISLINGTEKYFWRCIEIDFMSQYRDKNGDRRKNENLKVEVNLTLYLVDSLGLEHTNNKITLKMQNPDELKIFNIFSKKDSPLHFNMVSNSSWLEVFLLGKILIKKAKLINRFTTN